MTSSESRTEADPRIATGGHHSKATGARPRSRAEGLKRGLCESEVLAEDVHLVQARASRWYYSLKPQNYFHAWLVDQVAVLSLRIDRCERIERRLRDRSSLHAEVAWDDDRKREVEALGGRLARRPAEVSEQLRGTPLGCDWLIRRWALLAQAADARGDWSPEQRRLAFDLLATPPEFRDGRPGAEVDADGRVVDLANDSAAVARREIAALRDRRARVADLDEVDRSLVEADLFDDASPEIRRLRRHEATLHGRIRWCLAQLKHESPHFKPHPDLKPQWVAEPEAPPEAAPAPAPAPEAAPPARPLEAWQCQPPHPPFDLEPEECPEPGVEVDLPAILAGRRLKKGKAAEARRQARRRRLEHLRA